MAKKKEDLPDDKIRWKKKNGKEVITNTHPDNIKAAENLGWERVK